MWDKERSEPQIKQAIDQVMSPWGISLAFVTGHNRCVKFTLTAGDEKATVGANYNKKRALEAKEVHPYIT